jgi:hypothetical protein
MSRLCARCVERGEAGYVLTTFQLTKKVLRHGLLQAGHPSACGWPRVKRAMTDFGLAQSVKATPHIEFTSQREYTLLTKFHDA